LLEFFKGSIVLNMEPYQRVLLSIGGAFSALVMILAVLQWFHIWTYVSEEKRQNKLYFLISLFPVSTVCCLIGMCVPRTSLVLSSAGLLYFLTCMFVLISLLRNLFGSRESLSNSLKFDRKQINFQSPPFCCFCFCLPKISSNTRNLRRIEWLILQAPIVRALIVLFNLIAVAEFREESLKYVHWAEMIGVGSLLMAIFGTHTLARLTSGKLSHYGFMTIFRLIDVALLFYTAQQPMIFENILVRFGVVQCGPALSAQDNARFICNFVIITEMLLLSLCASILLAPSRSALFDRYPHGCGSPISTSFTDESMLTHNELSED
uniref:Organic solute transporter alpha-like protein 3 (inferred by orthology to a C. elegans protein) n=1 Tax=Anisakis simplex TaxID=6269 RepID=A0A0M3J0B1_ANISI